MIAVGAERQSIEFLSASRNNSEMLLLAGIGIKKQPLWSNSAEENSA